MKVEGGNTGVASMYYPAYYLAEHYHDKLGIYVSPAVNSANTVQSLDLSHHHKKNYQ